MVGPDRTCEEHLQIPLTHNHSVLHTRSSCAELDARRASVVVVAWLTRKPGTCVMAVYRHV